MAQKVKVTKSRSGAKKESGPKAVPERIRNSKKARLLAALRRPEGATKPEIMEITGWKQHSVGAFISKATKKESGLKVVQAVRFDGPNAYRIEPSSEG